MKCENHTHHRQLKLWNRIANQSSAFVQNKATHLTIPHVKYWLNLKQSQIHYNNANENTEEAEEEKEEKKKHKQFENENNFSINPVGIYTVLIYYSHTHNYIPSSFEANFFFLMIETISTLSLSLSPFFPKKIYRETFVLNAISQQQQQKSLFFPWFARNFSWIFSIQCQFEWHGICIKSKTQESWCEDAETQQS